MKMRALTVAVVSFLTLGSHSATSQPLEKVTLAFPFAAGAYFANYVPVVERFAKGAGLDVTLISPASGSDGIKLLTSGTVQFGMADTAQVILARSRAVPVISIAAALQSAPVGMLVTAESGIRTIKDLQGKTLGITGIPATRKFLEHVLNLNGIGLDKVKMVEVGFAGLQMLLAGKVDAFEAASFTKPFELNQARGKPLNDLSTSVFLSYPENGGHPYYFYTINVTDDYRAKNANTIRKFVKAWRDGTEWSINNPEEAVRMFLKRYPESNPELSLVQWKAVAALSRSPDTNAHGLGWQNPAVYSGLAAFLYDNKLMPERVDPATAFTNVYLSQ